MLLKEKTGALEHTERKLQLQIISLLVSAEAKHEDIAVKQLPQEELESTQQTLPVEGKERRGKAHRSKVAIANVNYCL